VRVGTPLGEYPFEFRRLERRGSSLVVVGELAGLESSVVLGPDDQRALARRAALPLAALALVVAWRRSAR
jgi:chorismate-pyruvate lyase